MSSGITRRDFIDGALAGAAALALGPLGTAAAASPYPPALTGLRGNAPGSFDAAHALAREGNRDFGAVGDDAGAYDLVVVGAGISGLAVARFYQQRFGADASILILDNNDDFGGHARRNEFRIGKALRIAYGGSQSLDAPSRFPRSARALLKDLAVDTGWFDEAYDWDFFRRHKLGQAVFFDEATYGRDVVVPANLGLHETLPGMPRGQDMVRAIDAMPLPGGARAQLKRLYGYDEDGLKDVAKADLLAYLARTPYEAFLREKLRMTDPAVFDFLRAIAADDSGLGTDMLCAGAAWAVDLPGIDDDHLKGMEDEVAARFGGEDTADDYVHHFPDGNASIARLLVARLIPAAVGGRLQTMGSVPLAAFDYGQLDRPGAPVRLRLDATAVDVAHDRDSKSADSVQVTYIRDGKAARARARHVVLACWNSVVPHICPELPADQRAALALNVKVPFVYTSVALRRWHGLKGAGLGAAYCPGGLHNSYLFDIPVRFRSYGPPASPDQPVTVTFTHTPLSDDRGSPPRDQFRAGRQAMLARGFDDYERDLRRQLGGMCAGHDFDFDRDVAAITVNRWGHGYSYTPNPLFDDMDQSARQLALARRPFGRITIANADSAMQAFAHAAIDQADRAVRELAG